MSSYNLRPVLFINGVLLAVLAAAMLLPAVADALAADDGWKIFASASAVTIFFAVLLVIATRQERGVLAPRQAFLVVSVSWVAAALFGSLPFLFSEAPLSFVDAFFEAASGITTTGATVMTGLESLSPGLLLWRAILQWLGGIGLVLMAVILLPELRVGGMQFFRPEAGIHGDSSSPRVVALAARVWAVYTAATLAGLLLLLALGLKPLDALVHAMTSVATGGFSNYDASIAAFDSSLVEAVLILLMIAGALPFLQLLRALSGDGRALFRDGQVRWMLSVLAAAVIALALWLVVTRGLGLFPALRLAAFNTTSMMTGTGYATASYDQWGAFPSVLLVLLMIAGGCTGSTCSGLKVFRVRVLLATLRTQILRLSAPQAVLLVRYDGKPVPESVVLSVIAFSCLYLLTIAVTALLLAVLGLDAVSSLSGAVSAVANIGPAYGAIIGPAGNYAPLSDPVKLVLSFAMILGRLEIYAGLVIFTPFFWRD